MQVVATWWDLWSAGVEGDLAEVRGGNCVEQGAEPHPSQPRLSGDESQREPNSLAPDVRFTKLKALSPASQRGWRIPTWAGRTKKPPNMGT